MGTSDFGLEILKALVDTKYNIVGVYTKPDSLAGRKRETTEPPVKKYAVEKNFAVFQPVKFDFESVEELKRLQPDLIIVAAYGKILPKSVLDLPGFGCLNVHPSLLPKFRGPSPIQNALLLGESETGTTIMLMDEGMDTGAIIAQKKMLVNESDDAQTLSSKLSILSVELLLKTIEPWIKGRLEPKKQDEIGATLCQLIDRDDGRIIWEQDAQEIFNRFRALNPWPGIFTFWKSADMALRIKLLKISVKKEKVARKYKVGEVFEEDGMAGVQTGNGVIIIQRVQIEGKNSLEISDFINGYRNFIGSILF